MMRGCLMSLMLWTFIFALFVLLGGCAYGVSHYEVAPFMLDGKQTCCKIVIDNGKEIGQLKARFKKVGDNWDISLQEAGVKAFEGQAIASDLLKDVIPGIPVMPAVPLP